jgi:two-component sensor histidine kinase
MDAARAAAGELGTPAGKNIAAYRMTLIIAAAYSAVALALVTIADRPGPTIPGISAFFASGVFVTELATAFLLFVRFRDARSASLLLLGCAYLFSALMALPYLLTFPGAVLLEGSVVGNQQSVAWIFILWIFGFALIALGAVVAEAAPRKPEIAPASTGAVLRVAVVTVAVVVATLAVLPIAFVDRLPLLVDASGWSMLDTALSLLNMGMLLAAALIALVVIRERSEIFQWASLALVAMFFGNVLSTYGGGRFTIGWSVSRLSWVFSGCALFLYFMGQFVRQQRLLARTREALEQRVGERTADLTSMIAQRDLLLREVHHRVKNNFQVINSLINFQASHAASEETRAALHNLHGRVYALGLVHQRLMQSNNLSTFDIRAFLDDLCGNLASLSAAEARGIAVHAEADPLQTDLDFAGPLGLLVTELVTAAFARFGAGESGAIGVSLRRSADGRLALIVRDDAPAHDGDDAGQSRILRALVGQLRGELSLAHETGTVATVLIPEPQPRT